MPTHRRIWFALALLFLVSLVSSAAVLHVTGTPQTTNQIPSLARAPISALIGSSNTSYAAVQDERTIQFTNAEHALTAQMDDQGIHFSSNGAEFGMAIKQFGYDGVLEAVQSASPTWQGNRVEYARGAVTEWYVNGPFGIEQGFTLHKRPAPHTDSEMIVEMELSGNVQATVDADGLGLTLDGLDRVAGLRYGGLIVTDAAGKTLEARMTIENNKVSLRVNDADAQYPITIDPFVQKAKLGMSDGNSNSQFGYAVAVSGNTIAVGAPFFVYGNNEKQGAVYVFMKPAAGWSDMTQVARLKATDNGPGHYMATTVAIDGDTIVAGANSFNLGQGVAYIWVKPSSGWVDMTETARLTPSVVTASNFFGSSVAVSGDTVVVGVRGWNNYSGALMVYVKPAGGWAAMTETAILTTSDELPLHHFGWSVAIQGDTIVGGTFDYLVADVGVYVYAKPIGGWTTTTETARLRSSDGAAGDQFGLSVAVNGTTIVVGANRADLPDYDMGAVYVYVQPDTGWANATETAKLVASDGAYGAHLGESVAVNGDTIVAGAPLAKPNNQTQRGAAYVFVKPPTGWANTLTETNKLIAADGTVGDEYGNSVALSADALVIGAHGLDVGAHYEQGAAYVYGAGPTCSTFTDVPKTNAFYPYINDLWQGGIVSLYEDCSFQPDQTLNRGQAVKWLVMASSYPPISPSGYTYADVQPASPFYSYVELAAQHGMISGYACGGVGEACDGLNRDYFRPFVNTTRGQFIKMLALMAGWTVSSPTKQIFADVPSTDPFYSYVQKAFAQGIVFGYPCGGAGESCDSKNRPYFRPATSIKRGQTAKAIDLASNHCTGKPGKFKLTAPKFGKPSGKQVQFVWEPSTCSLVYNLTVRQDSETGKKVVSVSVYDAVTYSKSLPKGHTYYWSIQAGNGHGGTFNNPQKGHQMWNFQVK